LPKNADIDEAYIELETDELDFTSLSAPKTRPISGLNAITGMAVHNPNDPITECREITSGGDYILANPISNPSEDCIIFGSDNINLDCNGLEISGKPALKFLANNISIINCKIHTEEGINYPVADNIHMYDTNISSTSGSIVALRGGNHKLSNVNFDQVSLALRPGTSVTTIENINMNVPSCSLEYEASVIFVYGDENTFSNINIDSNGCSYGIYLIHAKDNALNDITIQNTRVGLLIYDSDRNTIDNLQTINTLFKDIRITQSSIYHIGGNVIQNSRCCKHGLECNFDPSFPEENKKYPIGSGNQFDAVTGCKWTVDDQYSSCSEQPSPPQVNCTDSIKNQDETDIDCGGDCPACVDEKNCSINTDCQSNNCENFICRLAPSCIDSIQNQDETDIDCGGSCQKCQSDKSCSVNSDCFSSICENNLCKDLVSCTDSIQNNDETDIDCGKNCNPCELNQSCLINQDCTSNLCLNLTCYPALSCTDSIKNQNETDIDCGGNCDRCNTTQSCNINQDCISDFCINNTCIIYHCQNSIKDYNETDIDCGSTCDRCSINQACQVDEDCTNNNCVEGICKSIVSDIYSRVKLNNQLIYETVELTTDTLDIKRKIKQALENCQEQTCNINIDFETKNQLLNIKKLYIKYKDKPTIKLNGNEVKPGRIDIKPFLTKQDNTYSATISSNSPVVISNLEITYILTPTLENLQQFVTCENYPCRIPLIFRSTKGGNIIISKLLLE